MGGGDGGQVLLLFLRVGEDVGGAAGRGSRRRCGRGVGVGSGRRGRREGGGVGAGEGCNGTKKKQKVINGPLPFCLQ